MISCFYLSCYRREKVLFQLLILSRLGMNRDVASCCMIYTVNYIVNYVVNMIYSYTTAWFTFLSCLVLSFCHFTSPKKELISHLASKCSLKGCWNNYSSYLSVCDSSCHLGFFPSVTKMESSSSNRRRDFALISPEFFLLLSLPELLLEGLHARSRWKPVQSVHWRQWGGRSSSIQQMRCQSQWALLWQYGSTQVILLSRVRNMEQ